MHYFGDAHRREGPHRSRDVGMNDEEREEFLLSTIDPMARYTLPFALGIIGVESHTKGIHLGSGFRCFLNGHRCVVSAQHVIFEATQKYEHFAIPAGYGFEPFVFHGDVLMNADFDVAICLLPDDYPDDYDRRQIAFWPQERFDLDDSRRATDYLFLHGYPGERSRFNEPVMGVSSKSLPYGAMEQVTGLPPTAKEYNFALNYDLQPMCGMKGSLPELVDPHGLSGCGIWRIGISGGSAAEWHPDDSWLVGVQIEYHADEKVLLATEIRKVIELLNRTTG